jgi:hypothetical protein
MISTTDRDTRVAEIQAAALVRQALGQAAAYRRLPDGRHQVAICGRTATGPTLTAAIDAARCREGRPWAPPP